LKDQQREIVHEAADAIAEMDRAYLVLQTSYNRLVASRDQLDAVSAAYENEKVTLDLFLDAQRRLAEAEIEYYLNRARYSLAAKNVHFVKGTLLEYDGVYLAEGPWPGEAYHDAAKREASRSRPVPLNYASSQAPRVSRGAFGQHAEVALPVHATIPGTTSEPVEEELPLQPSSGPRETDGPSLQPQVMPLPPPADGLPGEDQPGDGAASGESEVKSTVVVLTGGAAEASATSAVRQIRFRPNAAAGAAVPADAPVRLPPAPQP
jgi:hypothetical protein